MPRRRKRNLRRRRYRPRRLRKPPPFTEDQTLRNIGLGIVISEGTPICKDRAPALRVEMCDEKAVKMVSASWGTSIYRGRPLSCKPTPQNPQGKSYLTDASGARAQLIMHTYEPEIIGTETHKKYEQKKRECTTR